MLNYTAIKVTEMRLNNEADLFSKSIEHKIAVKVVDNDGLENVEVIKLKVNGKVETE
jgi:hypothetical protein